MVPDAEADLSHLELDCIIPPQKIHLHVFDCAACLESITSTISKSLPGEQLTLWNSIAQANFSEWDSRAGSCHKSKGCRQERVTEFLELHAMLFF